MWGLSSPFINSSFGEELIIHIPMRTLILLLFFCFYGLVHSQNFYEVKWTGSDQIQYTALIEFFEKENINVRVKFSDTNDNYKVAKFSCKGSYYTDNGKRNFLFDGSNASIVYPEYSPNGYSADNFLFTGLDDQNRYEKLYTYDDNDLADGHIELNNEADFRILDPTKDFTEDYVYSFFEKHEPEYNKYLSLHLGSHGDNDFYKLKFQNKCSKELQTLIRFKNYAGDWETKGWWILEPGETAYVEDTKNSVFYFYAEATDGSKTWQGTDNFKTFKGKKYGFRKLNTSKGFGDWTTNLTCTQTDPVPAPEINTESKLHLVFVADTQDPRIGLSVENDMNDIANLFRKATKEIGMKFQATKIYGNSFDLNTVNAKLNSLKPASNDVIIFYYSGHGFNDTRSYNRFPEMALDGPDLGLSAVHQKLKSKNARLTLTIGDLCNSLPQSRRRTESQTEIPFKSGFLFDSDKLTQLLLQTKGDLISTSSKKGQWSYTMYDDSNGHFTSAFIDAFTKEVSKVSNANGSWTALLRRAYTEAKNNTSRFENQDGSYGQSGVYSSNLKS